MSKHFDTLPTRRADYLLTDAVDSIEAWLILAIYNINPDFIMTHNPVGEYGHGSHRLLFEIVSQLKIDKKPEILITDICQKSNHRSHDEIPESVQRAYYYNLKRSHSLDYNFYDRCKLIYDKYSAWTWCYPPIDKCNLWVI